MSKNKVDFSKGIYDARQLGVPRMLLLGFQHMFAMFGATVLVPLITGLDIATTLLMAGLGTLLFHVFTKFKVPAFLGSSFAFLGGYATVAPKLPDANGELTIANTEMLPYACVGVACAGLLYLVLATIIKIIGINKVMRFFPPVVTGPIIVAIGLGLAPTAISNCQNNWWLALIALGIVIVVNVFGKGMAKIIPILIGILGAYAVAGIVGNGFGVESFAIDFSSVKEAAWVGLPVHWSSTVFGGVHDTGKAVTAIIAIMPIALATMMEHIGDISAPPAARIILPIPVCTVLWPVTAWQRPCLRCSAVPPIPLTVRTPACWRCLKCMTPESFVSLRTSPFCSPSLPSLLR